MNVIKNWLISEKRFGSLFLLLFVTIVVSAEQVTPKQAREKALQFFSQTNASLAKPQKAKAVANVYQVYPINTRSTTTEDADYYIFNVTSDDAFVVVSGESTTQAVLAYSYEGGFSNTNIAPATQYFLECYAEQIQQIKAGAAQSTSVKSYVQGQNPILTATWNQDAPYHNNCPVVNNTICYTGCVATAMGIIMKHHDWPETGRGTFSYTSETINLPLSADFGSTSYDWANATPSYDSNSTATEKAAVAQILYHCGVAAGMDYNTVGSAAYVENACKALKYNFRYSPYTHVFTRTGLSSNLMDLLSIITTGKITNNCLQTYYDDASWKALLKAEIDANRPVLYAGTTETFGAHAFVCDGYDTSGKFHFNMGWGGGGNGYYSIDAISSGFNYMQSAIMGITPDTDYDGNALLELGTETTANNMGLVMNDTANIIPGCTFTLTAKDVQPAAKAMTTGTIYGVAPYAYSTFSGYYAAALYSADGQFKSLISSATQVSLTGANPYQPTANTQTLTCCVPANVNMEATDRIWLVGSTDKTTWYRAYCTNLENSSVAVSGYKNDMTQTSGLVYYHPSATKGIHLETEANVEVGQAFTVNAYWLNNYTGTTFAGLCAYALYTEDGTYKGLISPSYPISLQNGNGYSSFSTSCTIGEDLHVSPTDKIWLVTSADDGTTWARVYEYGTTDETNCAIAVSGYDGVFFCEGNNGRDAYVYGTLTDDVLTKLTATTTADVTRIDFSKATISSATINLTGTNPNAITEGTSAAITGALTKTQNDVTLTDGYPFYSGDDTFSPNNISYSRDFNPNNASSISSQPLWQTICLPFDVEKITFNEKEFSANDFWLYQLTADGYERVRTGNIQKNIPYLIAFANAAQYESEGVNVSGTVHFTGSGTLKTEAGESATYVASNYKLANYYAPKATNAAYYALNEAGTHFISGDAVSPFRPYAIVPDEVNPAKGRVLDIFAGTTSIDMLTPADSNADLQICAVQGGIKITTAHPAHIAIVLPSGATAGVFDLSAGTRTILLPQGVYIVQGKKIVVNGK